MATRSLSLFVVCFASACSILEGAPCSGAVGSCDGRGEGLYCLDGRVTRIRCDGARGCSETGGAFYCDQSVARVGDRCAQESGGACTANSQSFLRCTAGRYALVAECRGPGRCGNDTGVIRCDQSLGSAGEPCTSEGVSCTPARDAWSRCTSGRFEAIGPCRGPRGCRIEGTQVLCDQSIAMEGDPCASEGGGACSSDHGSLLLCRAGSYDAPRPCGGARRCSSDGAQVFCDQTIGSIGDVCAPEGARACHTDGRRTLVCRAGTFQEAERCAGRCAVADNTIICR